MLEKTKESLLSSKVIQFGTEENYFLNGISDGIPYVSPLILEELTDYIINNFILDDIERIVCIESMGIPIATSLSLKTKIPFTIIRKKNYKLKNEYEIIQNTSYKKNKKLYINGLEPNMNVLLIDDVISTGGTIVEIIDKLKKMKINIINTIILIEIKNDYDKSHLNYDSLIEIEIKNKKVKVVK